jgi:protein-S-isoprenylcysteine O-methyltransferase Ste14
MIDKSKLFGRAQTILICIFGAVLLFAPGERIIAGGQALGIVGEVLALLGAALVLVAVAQMGKTIHVHPEPKAEASLVTTGIYRWFRHPIYTGMLLAVMGLFLCKPTLRVGAVGALVIIFLAVKVRFEEKLLLERYPNYGEYMKRSWGLIPLGRV